MGANIIQKKLCLGNIMLENEIEIKLKVNDLPKLTKKLRRLGAELASPSKQTTVRFDTYDSKLEKMHIFLRVREGIRNTITMKEKIKDYKDIRARKETELEIENIDSMIYIIRKLGFNNIKKNGKI